MIFQSRNMKIAFLAALYRVIQFREEFTTDGSRVGGVRMAAPPLIEPDVRLFRIRLSCSLSPQAFTGGLTPFD